MSAVVRVLPFVDGQTAVQIRAGTMPLAARDLGFIGIANAMHYSECENLARLDKLVSELSAMLHGYEIALERHATFESRCDRALARNLSNDIANYMQSRANELG